MSATGTSRGAVITITSAITILASDNIREVSILVLTGATCDIAGDYPWRGSAGGSGTLPAGGTVTITSKTGDPLSGWTITPAGGSVILVLMTS